MNIIRQTTFCLKWIYYNKIRVVRRFRAHNSLIRRNFWAHNRLDNGLGLNWAMVAQSSGQWSDSGLIRGPFRLGRSDQRQFRAHLERTRCFERTLIWSEDTLVCEGLIRRNFRLAWSDQGPLPDGTSTWDVHFIVRSKLPLSTLTRVQRCLCSDFRAFIGVSRPFNFERTTRPSCVHFGLDISTFDLAPQPG